MSFDDRLASLQEDVKDLIDALESGDVSMDDADEAVESQKEQIDQLKEQISGTTGDMETKEIAHSS